MKYLFVLLTIAGLFLAGCGQQESQAEAAVEPQIVKVDVEGMTCDGCVNSIKSAMAESEGVVECEVSLEQNLATISYDPSKTSPDALVKTIEDHGYGAKVAKQ